MKPALSMSSLAGVSASAPAPRPRFAMPPELSGGPMSAARARACRHSRWCGRLRGRQIARLPGAGIRAEAGFRLGFRPRRGFGFRPRRRPPLR
eukprot:scaffold17044_cov59-Phaeocystis_antarctica.AAC.7